MADTQPPSQPTIGPVRMENFLAEVLGLLGTPYLWNGKDREGIDCSGVVTYALEKAGGPKWRATHNSERLFEELPSPEQATEPIEKELERIGERLGDDAITLEGQRKVLESMRTVHAQMVSSLPSQELLPGDLVFYPRHVMVHLASGLVVGACGGSSKTTTLEAAKLQNAKVKLQRRYNYRGDVTGFRRIPFLIPRGDMRHGVIRD